MTYRDYMDQFSTCGLGTILTAEDGTILDINERGRELFQVDFSVCGKNIEELTPNFSEKHQVQENEVYPQFYNTGFGMYIRHCGAIHGEPFPPGTSLLLFRDATSDFTKILLENIMNHVKEAITLWDLEGRLLFVNDAAKKLEVHVDDKDIGKYVNDLYEARNNSIMVIPKILKDKKPVLNLRQDFQTYIGKDLQIISDNYPIMGNGKMMGAFSMMDDYTAMDAMHRQIIDLQRQLLEKKESVVAKKGNILPAKYTFKDIIYSSKTMNRAVSRSKLVAKSDSPVMIYGETGTGKELFAQSIHNASNRKDQPFLAVNCAAIPTTLLESILFGTEKGAYTGAEKREGLFEQANHGTLLLDEINSMDIVLQSKLLRVLQEGCFFRVGGSKQINVDVRIISNINVPPRQAIEEGKLREDLYYRLGVVNITIPPLRQRKEDIFMLCRNFMENLNKTLQKNAGFLSHSVEEMFESYDWPGNVRELRHAIESALNIIPEEMGYITSEYIPDHIFEAVNGDNPLAETESSENRTMEDVLQEAGYRYLRKILQEQQGNISKAAKVMGITRQNLQHRLKKYKVDVRDFQ